MSGSVETDVTEVTSDSLLTQAVSNMRDSREGTYGIVRGSRPVNEFGRPPREEGSSQREADTTNDNLFVRAYPCLFPRGVGGIESPQQVPISFQEHIKWALQYFDRRFRLNVTFPYIAFGIIQK